MKTLFLTLAVLLSAASINAQITSYYQFNSPLPSMDPSFTNAHGVGMDLLLPVKKGFSAGFNFSYNNYGYQREPYSFITTDGMLYETYLRVSNNFYQAGLASQYLLPVTFRRFQPFVDARVNAVFFQTDLIIEDPEDETNCEPLESHILMKDVTAAATLSFGFNFLFTGTPSENISESNGTGLYFFMTGGITMGGKVNYMNVEAGPSHFHHQGTAEPDKNSYSINFINTKTQVVHQHHAGYLYSSSLRMAEIKAGFRLRF